ncbi:uncharacterized protein LOC129765778 [Toxorhynchites rutilus septentrionalis]|uniref:uncharacterized protein LOC129765778 n=1 Tax=Toxorhynchites rutilus septentrionalis TaxID=329112 RepID=UPI0024786397|nr:uncharacterized protein LOC129765778 [Toxorhynchites rutilus septentrionalis]
MSVQSSTNTILLETVALEIVDDHGNVFQARALLDSGSMSNFISRNLANRLTNPQTKVDVSIAGIGQSLKKLKRTLTATVRSRINRFCTKLEFLIIQQPTADLPTVPVQTSSWQLPAIEFADPKFNVPGRVDIIIGGEAYWELHTGNKIHLGQDLPQAVETPFGWTICGPTSKFPSVFQTCYHVSTMDERLENVLQKFWELEAIRTDSNYSTAEKYCEEFYANTTTRDSSGRYVVRLPRKVNPEIILGESRSVAERRFLSLERRMERDVKLKIDYVQFMEEYETVGHMKQIIQPVDYAGNHCYLPHHPVFKLSSNTTKTRVVFDASCKTMSGYSLNDALMVGPALQQDLLSIVMRFRMHPIALVADIQKMFRQILVHPEDQPFQRVLWRSNPSNPIATYELQTVTYGTASAPYLAIKTLQEAAREANQSIAEDFYVDDLLTGARDVQSSIQLMNDISTTLESAGFQLKKWASNSVEVMQNIPPEDLAIQELYNLHDDQSVSTLGLA